MRLSSLAAALLLAALPLALLHPCLWRGHALVPFDARVFAPHSLTLAADQLAALQAAANFDITETTLVHAAELRFAQDELARGRFPSWDPYVRCGGPLFANGVSGLAYPLNVLHWWFEPERAFASTAWIGLALAGVLMFGLLRELGTSPLAALLGAVAFAWSGTMAGRVHLYSHYTTLLWLPAQLWAIERIARGGGVAAVAALAIAIAMTCTAGYAPAAIAVLLTASGWLLVRALGQARRTPTPALGTLVKGIAGGGLGLGLAAYLLAPMAAYFLGSDRGSDAALLALRRAHELDPCEWLNLVLEAPFSTPALNRDGGVPHNKAPLLWLLHSRAGSAGIEPVLKFTEHRLYLGAVPLTLLLGSLAQPRVLAWLLPLGGAALLGAAAGRWPWEALGATLPVIRFLQPMELMPPVACLLAISAALGLDRVRTHAGARRLATTTAVGIALACGVAALLLRHCGAERIASAFVSGLAARWGEVFDASGASAVHAFFAPTLVPATELLIRNLHWGALLFGIAAVVLIGARWQPRWCAGTLVAVTMIELLVCAQPLVRAQAVPHGESTPIHGFLRAERDRLAPAGGFTVARVAAPHADGRASVPETPLALPPNLLLPERIRDLNAYAFADDRSHRPFAALYDGASPPLLIRGRWLNALPDDDRLAHPLLDLFGVRYLLCHVGLDRTSPRHAGREVGEPVVTPAGAFRIFERPEPCPRAFVVPNAVVVADDNAAVRALVRDDFDPRAALLLSSNLDDHGLDRSGTTGGGAVRFALDQSSHVVIEVKGTGGGHLVLADAWMPGWSATVNGTTTPIRRANLCMRAVPIPAGDVTVTFRYHPPGSIAGASISILTALGLLVCAWRSHRRRPAVAATATPRVGPFPT